MSEKWRRSLYQELQGVTLSRRRIILSAKATIGSGIQTKPSDPIESHPAGILGREPVLAEDLRLLIAEVCSQETEGIVPLPNLKRASKRPLLKWITENWTELRERFTAITANQRTITSGKATNSKSTEKLV
jgi:hypothetical protein